MEKCFSATKALAGRSGAEPETAKMATGVARVRRPMRHFGLMCTAARAIVGRPGCMMASTRLLRFLQAGALRAATCAVAMILAAAPCLAQSSKGLADYPVKPIRIIVASSPGAADDYFARLVGEDLAAFYGQRVVIENRPGAGGLIGNLLLSRANADGYTLGMVGVTRIITELVRDQPPYRALGDIVGVAHVASITNVLAVTSALPVRTDRKSTRLNSSHIQKSRMPSSA